MATSLYHALVATKHINQIYIEKYVEFNYTKVCPENLQGGRKNKKKLTAWNSTNTLTLQQSYNGINNNKVGNTTKKIKR